MKNSYKILLKLVLFISLISSACSPNPVHTVDPDPEPEKQAIGGSMQYATLITFVDVATSLTPGTNEITPEEASLSYTILPEELPQGLIFEENTGKIYGTPEIETVEPIMYTVTVSGIGQFNNSIQSTFTININPPRDPGEELDISSSSIKYENNIIRIIGQALPIFPSTSIVPADANVKYSIEPELPSDSGLKLDKRNGIIRGEATSVSTTTHRITVEGVAPNTASVQSEEFTIIIRLSNSISEYGYNISYNNLHVPSNISVDLSPQSNIPTTINLVYSINPELPEESGLSFDEESGIISGTTLSDLDSQEYIVRATANNYTGYIVTEPFTIAISSLRKLDISYFHIAYEDATLTINSPVSFGLAPTTNIPPQALVEYTISKINLSDPTLPTNPTDISAFPAELGLSFDNSTGMIAGTPLIHLPTTTYWVRARGISIIDESATDKLSSSGILDTEFTITINKLHLEITLDYVDSEILAYENINIQPQVTTVPVIQYLFDVIDFSISRENLPPGLEFSKDTGIISGIPEMVFDIDFQVTALAKSRENYEGFVQSESFNITFKGFPITGNLIYPSTIRGVLNYPIYIDPIEVPTPQEAQIRFFAISESTAPFQSDILTLNSITGQITGRGNYKLFGTVQFQAVATNTDFNDTPILSNIINYDFIHESNDDAISIQSIQMVSLDYPRVLATVGTYISVSHDFIPVSSSVTLRYFLEDKAIPNGLNFNHNTGKIYGVPQGLQSNTEYIIRARGTERYYGEISSSFNLEIVAD